MTNTLSSNRLFAALLVAGTAFGLAACGGKSSTKVEDKVATEDIEVQVTESTVPVLYQAPLEFESGVTELGTSTPTTLTFTANDTNAATPLFSVATDTDTASGVTTFGSCIFTVTASTFAAEHALAVGKQVTISPCEVPVPLAGTTVGVDKSGATATLVLGTATSKTFTLPVIKIKEDGSVTIGDIAVGTVTVSPVTGA
ncbi:MAG TPA: hypothetical protein VKZ88_01845 [Fibrobacteria bacterium]|nr:hypothetical protein [Fibrobacteria bacterium]